MLTVDGRALVAWTFDANNVLAWDNEAGYAAWLQFMALPGGPVFMGSLRPVEDAEDVPAGAEIQSLRYPVPLLLDGLRGQIMAPNRMPWFMALPGVPVFVGSLRPVDDAEGRQAGAAATRFLTPCPVWPAQATMARPGVLLNLMVPGPSVMGCRCARLTTPRAARNAHSGEERWQGLFNPILENIYISARHAQRSAAWCENHSIET